ncbi:MAG: EamA family transporter [Actinomycetota bacterium]
MSLGKSITLILISITIAVGGQILLKIGMNRIGSLDLNGMGSLVRLFVEVAKSPIVLVGLFMYVISAALWLIVLSGVDLSFAYPFIGLTYVFVLILSRFILKEDVNPIRWAGAAIITLGVIVLSRG